LIDLTNRSASAFAFDARSGLGTTTPDIMAPFPIPIADQDLP